MEKFWSLRLSFSNGKFLSVKGWVKATVPFLVAGLLFQLNLQQPYSKAFRISLSHLQLQMRQLVSLSVQLCQSLEALFYRLFSLNDQNFSFAKQMRKESIDATLSLSSSASAAEVPRRNAGCGDRTRRRNRRYSRRTTLSLSRI